jgi:methionyl-tRNA formyltransferase
MLRIALLCEEAAGARVLQMLARSGHQLAAVLTSPPAAGRPHSPVWKLAEKLGLVPIPAPRVREPAFCAELEKAGMDVLLNVHSLHIVPEAVLRTAALGAYNLHPGPLPQLAGLNAPSWALYLGAAEHAVTLHRMEPGIDTGPVVYEERFPIEPEDTGLTVALRCVEKGVPLVARLVDELDAGASAVPLKPQERSLRRYFGRAAPQGGRLRWDQSARRIHAFVRACDYFPFPSPWGAPGTRLEGHEVQILSVALTGEPCGTSPGTVRIDESERALVATADEWLWVRRMGVGGRQVAPREALAAGQRLG